jgi:hypothetical protein
MVYIKFLCRPVEVKNTPHRSLELNPQQVFFLTCEVWFIRFKFYLIYISHIWIFREWSHLFDEFPEIIGIMRVRENGLSSEGD